jgi:hypothetical protein
LYTKINSDQVVQVAPIEPDFVPDNSDQVVQVASGRPRWGGLKKNTLQQDSEIWFVHKDKLTFK